MRAAAAMRSGDQREKVTLSATEFIIADVLAPALPRLLSRHPDLAVTLRSEATIVSLAARAADIAVRMSQPEGSSLFARKLTEQRLGLFANSGYLAGREPSSIELASERLLIYDDSYGRLPELDWVQAGGLDAAVTLRSNSTRALLAATIAGAGIGLLPVVHGRAASLTQVPTPFAVPSRAPWLLVHRDLRRVPAIRAVLTWVVAVFKDQALVTAGK